MVMGGMLPVLHQKPTKDNKYDAVLSSVTCNDSAVDLLGPVASIAHDLESICELTYQVTVVGAALVSPVPLTVTFPFDVSKSTVKEFKHHVLKALCPNLIRKPACQIFIPGLGERVDYATFRPWPKLAFVAETNMYACFLVKYSTR